MSNIGNYRARWHDYSKGGLYHITLKKSPETPVFGRLAGDLRLPAGTPGSSYIQASVLGRIIKDVLRTFGTIHPALKLYQYALMPDHLHLLIKVENDMDEILGRKIAIFKQLVNKRSNLPSVFAKGFNDQILNPSRELDVVFNYLRQNPYRLAIRFAHPEFFSRVNTIKIGDKTYETYGNFQLLRNPFMEQVVVHRRDSEEKKSKDSERWLHVGFNGGVLVSPFISKTEKEVRREAEAGGARIILLTHEKFPERFKPAAHDFALCSEGRLLIISLGEPGGTPLTREICLRMNALAQKIAEEKMFR